MAANIGAEFDRISEIYDTTRRAASDAEIKAVSSELSGCSIILDVGVGTGRFAKPLSDLGFEIVGIDVSRKMMSKAREKGVRNLILADAHNMPFKDKSFDASIIIHVLQLIPDWRNVEREMGRVTKSEVVALLSNRQREWNKSPNNYSSIWMRYAQLREEMGYPIRRNRIMWQNEEEIRSELPPMKLVKVSDEVVVMKIRDIITRFQEEAYPMLQDIPSDVHNEIIKKLLASTVNVDSNGEKMTSTIEDKQIKRRIVEELAVWRPDQLR